MSLDLPFSIISGAKNYPLGYKRQMKPVDYFASHPVFRFEDFASAHYGGETGNSAASKQALKQHLRAGHLLHIRRGLYAVVPRGTSVDALQLDPFLVASRLAPDAVIAYHSALQLHGKAYSLSRRITFLSQSRVKPFTFRGVEFVAVPVPSALVTLPDQGGGVAEVQRNGLAVRVTTLERTLVDVLDTPRYGGSWEEIWRSLESVEFFDVDAVTEYALKLGSAVTIAKLGFFLEQHRQGLMLDDNHLKRLESHRPTQPMYLERGKRESGTLLKRWNLIVPERVVNKTWAEVT